MEGFKDPWESSVFKGRLVVPDKTLQDCGISSGDMLICVRRVLVPEGGSLTCLLHSPWFTPCFVCNQGSTAAAYLFLFFGRRMAPSARQNTLNTLRLPESHSAILGVNSSGSHDFMAALAVSCS